MGKSVETFEDLKSLENESKRYLKNFQDSYDDTKLESLADKYEKAFIKATDKTFFFQFIPNLDINTPMKVVAEAYEVFSASDYKDKAHNLSSNSSDWLEIRGTDLLNDDLENSLEKKPIFLGSLRQFRQIIETPNTSTNEKVELINKLANLDIAFYNEFLRNERNESAGRQWMKLEMKKYGVPLVDKLFEMGFDTPEKIKMINIEEIKTVKGFGTQNIERLKTAIQKIV